MNKITPEIEQQICGMISDGLSFRCACAKIECSPSTFITRVNADKTLSEQYTRSINIRTELWAEEIVDIADDNSFDTKEIERNGQVLEVVDHDHINRARLRVDARKWVMSKMLPKKYGDKIDVTSGGESISKININLIAPDPKMKELYAPTGE